MKRFSAVYLAGGSARRMTFEAETIEEARTLAAGWNVGVEGETVETGAVAAALPEAYDLETTRRLLGGIGRSTVFEMLWAGKLERVPHIRRTLVTRRSIERLAAGKN